MPDSAGSPPARGASPAAGPQLRRRRASSSAAAAAAGAVLDTAKQVESSVERALLWAWDELPHWRRDNAFILSGYRPTSNSFRASAGSLLYLHNESVNIWSHLLGSFAAALCAVAACLLVRWELAPRWAGASSGDVVAFACFFGGAVACLGMSATYHALCNHSPEVARWGNKLDYTGIVFLIVGSYVPALYYGLFCLPGLMTVYLSMICILGTGCLTVSWFDHFRTPAWRPYRALMFVGLGVSGVVPVLHGMEIYGYAALNERMGLNWVLLQGATYIFGAFLYAARWPERTRPGKFDIWGSSHQLFHLLILLAAGFHLQGMTKAFDYHHSVMGAKC
ncbi:ADIPOR-like receptor IZH2 [Pleurostoma richardsiae]|uniref:ADIPOR-like receptor IZH2 n=1 Tax=Pleurostoma richardsiae TaxID=41990 RepID=A0AA38RMM7_9PEZI|nr:ADIPOR-like receptor IZH2 [Pleurostoma richardsiae]